MNGLLVFASAVVRCLVWITTIAPLIANAFGVPCKVAFWRIDGQNPEVEHFRVQNMGLVLIAAKRNRADSTRTALWPLGLMPGTRVQWAVSGG
jgi:hypothetical protein